MGTKKELTFEMWRTLERRCYFLMSSAGAGIGYALTFSNPKMNAFETWIFLVAIGFWSLSFVSGLVFLKSIQSLMSLSGMAITERGLIPNGHAQAHAILSEVVDERAKILNFKHNFAATLQVLTLLSGAIIFILLKIDISIILGDAK